MRSSLVIVLFSVVFLGVASAQFLSFREDLKPLLPKELQDFLKSLTPEQIKLLQLADKNHTLGLKALLASRLLLEKVAALPAPAQHYAQSYSKALSKLNETNEKQVLSQLIEKYGKLDGQTQEVLKAVFPGVSAALQSVEIRSLAGLKTVVVKGRKQ